MIRLPFAYRFKNRSLCVVGLSLGVAILSTLLGWDFDPIVLIYSPVASDMSEEARDAFALAKPSRFIRSRHGNHPAADLPIPESDSTSIPLIIITHRAVSYHQVVTNLTQQLASHPQGDFLIDPEPVSLAVVLDQAAHSVSFDLDAISPLQ